MDNKMSIWIERLINILIIVIFVSMTVIVFTQVVLRYVFDMNISWADEFSRYGMVWIAFLGATIGVKYGEHTRIDFFIKLLPKKGRVFIEITNKIISVVFLGVISYFSVTSLGDMMTMMTPSLQIPTGIVHLVIPICGGLMIIYLVLQAIDIFRNRNEKGDHFT
ncbi:TRAP transporter small permease [Virgibacillus sediminis]|uniref:TRAP transporter small permease n=1 Tax=Virgibacillus sediminis TaxID=202260 RepID=A0ABV7A402_9BACI